MRSVITEAVVELTLPDVCDVFSIEATAHGEKHATVKMGLALELKDFVVRTQDGQVLTVKRLLLSNISGKMLPVYDEASCMITYFTVEEADKPTVVGE